ncbi:unnamed protein product [Echinostoma caproni]|uniref:Uncharacterized protein n=1 Tax=Echinostoma caproni TaxID=27848 RepID=A0A3P8G1V1_9TREM|nr:unnamed protein product [Echinostoma caproni]
MREAVLSLDKNDPTTMEHGPRIIGLLTRRLENFLNSIVNGTAPGLLKDPASLQCRVLKLQHAAKWIFDSMSKANS